MAISVKINGVSAGARIVPSSIQFNRNIEYRGSAAFTLKCAANDVLEPLMGQSVEIFSGATRVWYGSIDSLTAKFLELVPGSARYIAWEVQAVTLEQRLDRHFVSPRLYSGLTAGAIVTDLMNSVGSGEGITLGTIEAGLTLGKVAYDNHRLTDAFAEIATGSGKIWMVDAAAQLHFVSRTTFTAPFVLDLPTSRRVNFQFTETKRDRRTRQLLRCGFTPFAPMIEVIQGDGATQNFTLSKSVKMIESIFITDGTRALGSGTFSGLPSAGETITVGQATYTFRATVDNTVFGEVKIGATAAECATNLAAAIRQDTGAGTLYSLPTWPNFTFTAIEGGASIAFFARQPGTGGNALTISEALTNFALGGAWPDTSPGTDGTYLTEQTFGIENVDVDKDWFYAPNEAGLLSTAVMDASTYAIVTYRPVGGDVIAVEDTALAATIATVEGTTGISENLAEAEHGDAPTALAHANGLLEAYSPTQNTIQFRVDSQVKPGQLLTVAFGSAPWDRLDGTWLIEEVSGYYVGNGVLDGFRYNVTAINGTRRGQWIQAWEQLTLGRGATSSVGGVGSGAGTGSGSGISNLIKDQELTANTNITHAAPVGSETLTVFVAQDATGGWTITWDAATFDSDTLVDVDLRANAITVFTFIGKGGKWHQTGIALQKP